jgi:DNA-binding PadR family transcriptional regulator
LSCVTEFTSFYADSRHQLQLEPLSAIELYCLIALANTDIHAYELTKCIRLDAEDRFEVSVAGVVLALKRMQARGWVEPAGANERPRRYRLTGWGRQQLTTELDRLASAVELGRRRLRAPRP